MEQELWNWTESAVEMIPFALLAGFYKEKEIRITKLSEEGFCFRTLQKIEKIDTDFVLSFYDMERDQYDEKTVSPECWRLGCQTEFFYVYAVTVTQEDYHQAVRKLFGQYDRYIRLKLEEDDGLLAETLTGYPAKKDEKFADSFAEQMQNWYEETGLRREWKTEANRKNTEMRDADENPELKKAMKQKPEQKPEQKHEREHQLEFEMGQKQKSSLENEPELALELDHPAQYTAFLEQDFAEFLRHYKTKNPIIKRCFSHKNPDRIYIGNVFCPLLFPEETVLFAMLKRAEEQKLAVTLTFSYVREEQLESTELLLQKLETWCASQGTELEIAVNDWAMADMLKERTRYLKPCLGTLLNKRKKDPRMAYKMGDHRLLEENSLNAEFYRDSLEQRFGITRFEWESCGYDQKLPNTRNHLHLPFYQTNTSQYCTLYAGVRQRDRGKQQLVTACGGLCETAGYLYPEHLHMVGRGNSLFGMDTDILRETGIADQDWEQTVAYCRSHWISRLVVACWW